MIPNKLFEDKGFVPRAAVRPMFIGGRQRLVTCFLVTRVRYGRFPFKFGAAKANKILTV